MLGLNCFSRNIINISKKFLQVQNRPYMSSFLPCRTLPLHTTNKTFCSHSIAGIETENLTGKGELDDLFKKVTLNIRGHDNEVIKSYVQFILMTTQELAIDVTEVKELSKEMHRRTLLKSAHVHKKHRVQYEWRTHTQIIQLRHLTGSTLNTFLEYIERNLPEGIAMQVSKTQLMKLPDHLLQVIKEHADIDTETATLLAHKTTAPQPKFEFPPPKTVETEHHF